jgi:polar amino acid transport system substrate-binding protein
MAGYRVGAIANSANLKVAQTIVGAEIVEFGATADVFADMIAALRSGEVDAFVDDDVVMIPLGEDPDFDVAFTAETRNPWGIGVKPGNAELLADLNRALDTLRADGRFKAVWDKWMPTLDFPLG